MLNPPEAEVIINRGLEYSYQGDYLNALKHFQRLIELYPSNPAGHFFKAAVWQVYMFDSASADKEMAFYAEIDSAIACANSILEEGSDPWAYFYLGAAYCYRATYEGWRRRYLRSLADGLKGQRFLPLALSLDSTLCDAYLGLGTYEYFRARANRYTLGIPIFGNPEAGISKMRRCAEHGRYFAVTAQHALAWALTQEGRPEEALPYTTALLERYPKNLTFRWQLIDIRLAQERWDETIQLAKELEAEFSSGSPPNYGNLAHAKLKSAQAYLEKEEWEACARVSMEILKYSPYKDQYVHLSDCLKEADKLLKTCQRHLKK
jgi:tetratricopeptide (TPR) repeat protein